jgi:hypothetical protein
VFFLCGEGVVVASVSSPRQGICFILLSFLLLFLGMCILSPLTTCWCRGHFLFIEETWKSCVGRLADRSVFPANLTCQFSLSFFFIMEAVATPVPVLIQY